MTVSNTKSFNEHISTGTETSWPFTFDVSDPTHVKVYVIDLNNVWTDVTANATVDVASKTVTYGPIDADYVLRIERVTPATQDVDLNTQGPLLPQVLEDALDKLTYISQEARNLADEVRDTVAKDIKFVGEWTSGTTYKTNQAVTRFGNLYVAKQSHTADSTNAPVDGASNDYWAIAAIKGASLNWKGTWTSGSTYEPNDAVELNGASYICLNAHTADSTNQPGSGSSWTTYWDKIVEVVPADGSITTVKLADGAVTPAKIDQSGNFSIGSLTTSGSISSGDNIDIATTSSTNHINISDTYMHIGFGGDTKIAAGKDANGDNVWIDFRNQYGWTNVVHDANVSAMELGFHRSNNADCFLDFHSEADVGATPVYPDFNFRIIRYAGSTGNTDLIQRGGDLVLRADEGKIWFYDTELGRYLTPQMLHSPDFVSGWLAMPSATVTDSTTVAHGLGVTPSNFCAILKCITADGGFAVGDCITISSASYFETVVWADATVLGFSHASVTVKNKNVSEALTLNPAYWNIKFLAWK